MKQLHPILTLSVLIAGFQQTAVAQSSGIRRPAVQLSFLEKSSYEFTNRDVELIGHIVLDHSVVIVVKGGSIRVNATIQGARRDPDTGRALSLDGRDGEDSFWPNPILPTPGEDGADAPSLILKTLPNDAVTPPVPSGNIEVYGYIRLEGGQGGRGGNGAFGDYLNPFTPECMWISPQPGMNGGRGGKGGSVHIFSGADVYLYDFILLMGGRGGNGGNAGSVGAHSETVVPEQHGGDGGDGGASGELFVAANGKLRFSRSETVMDGADCHGGFGGDGGSGSHFTNNGGKGGRGGNGGDGGLIALAGKSVSIFGTLERKLRLKTEGGMGGTGGNGGNAAFSSCKGCGCDGMEECRGNLGGKAGTAGMPGRSETIMVLGRGESSITIGRTEFLTWGMPAREHGIHGNPDRQLGGCPDGYCPVTYQGALPGYDGWSGADGGKVMIEGTQVLLVDSILGCGGGNGGPGGNGASATFPIFVCQDCPLGGDGGNGGDGGSGGYVTIRAFVAPELRNCVVDSKGGLGGVGGDGGAYQGQPGSPGANGVHHDPVGPWITVDTTILAPTRYQSAAGRPGPACPPREE